MTYVYMKRPSTAPRPHASPRYDTLMGIGLVVVYASNVTQTTAIIAPGIHYYLFEQL